MNHANDRCTDQGCTPTGTGPRKAATNPPSTADGLVIDVVSDAICPWCFIGKRRLEMALTLLGEPAAVRVAWRPFQLNPQMPPGGIERRAYRTAKFGSWERSQELDARVAAAGAGEGIAFAFDKMTRTPNTLDAHRRIWLAGKLGAQDAVVEALFRGYFTEGADVNDRACLLNLAMHGGISAQDAERLLDGDEGRAEVLGEEARYKSAGISSVPSFFLDGEFAFSGAAEPAMLAEAIRQALRRHETAGGER